MAKQGRPKIAWERLYNWLLQPNNKPARRFIMAFMTDYCTGLNEIGNIKDHKIRQRIRQCWREEMTWHVTNHCHKYLNQDQIDDLLSAVTAFYREKVRVDIK